MNKKEIMGLCEFLKIYGYENTDNISKFIFELEQENKRLTGAIQTYDILLKSNVEENKRLKNNWKKLKEYCEEVISTDNELYGTDLLDKMQELEQGSDINE